MVAKSVLHLAVVLCAGICLGQGETIQLRDKAAVQGIILAEKADQVVVDLGFTVLSVPREQIVQIVREEAAKSPASKKQKAVASLPRAVTIPEPMKTSLYTGQMERPRARSVRELVSLLGESVVQVRTPSGLGSGFFINEEGYLITNFHVIEGETQLSAEVYHQKNGQLDRKTYREVRIMAINKFADLALLKIEDKDAPKFKPVALGSADALAVGERVFAIGSPLGFERTVTEGILSTKTRQIAGELYLQTTTQINPGNSGGPLFNLNGEVVGVTNMKITFGEGLGFAIPVESIRFFLDHRDAYAYSNDNPGNAYRYLEPPSKTRHVAAKE